jgi:phage virion morphogenesis protein
MKMTIGVDSSEFSEAFNAINQKFGDLTPAMRIIAFYGENKIRKSFATETDPTGKPWLPSQRKLKRGGKTLTLTGALASSTSSRYSATSATWGTNRPQYDYMHQFGSETNHLPARPFIGITPEDVKKITEIIMDYVEKE